MTDREKVIKGLECCATNRIRREDCEAMNCTYLDLEGRGCIHQLIRDTIALLKAQEPATVEPKRIELADETKAWLDEMDAVDALGNIADICIDWDGYRTADGLGGLINEIWAYARYCADRLLQAQEARKRLEVHNVGNVDIPEGVTWEQFQAVMDGVVKALEHTDNGESWPYTEQEANNEVVYRDHG